MPGGNFRQHTESFIYWDSLGSGAYLCTKYTPVSLATAAEVATANAAGVKGNVGDIVVPTPVAARGGITVADRRIVGILQETQFSGKQVSVVVNGVSYVMVNAAIADASVSGGVLIHAVAVEQRTSVQTPFTQFNEIRMAFDPRATLTHNLVLADDPAITPATGAGTNIEYFPLGFALENAANKYEAIPVELVLGKMYA